MVYLCFGLLPVFFIAEWIKRIDHKALLPMIDHRLSYRAKLSIHPVPFKVLHILSMDHVAP
ncbi:hypothetical protein lbkm_0669 [Lachnospiraceae bacterium KM106-2]|nr:hypothetical protein lbkm_0669 [Lachnospiraceae bacterium KM106-2]